MYIAKQIFPFFLILLSFYRLQAQNALPLSEITLKDGLSQGMIYDILQTEDGFMWFATKDGLNRYDGKNFVVYRNSAVDSFSISDNIVLKLFEDSQKNLWIRTAKGLDVLDRKTNRFRHFIIDSYAFRQYESADITENAAGELFMFSLGQLYRFFPSKLLSNLPTNRATISNLESIRFLPISDSLENLRQLYITRNQDVYVTSNENFYLVQNNKLLPLNPPNLGANTRNDIYALTENQNGDIVLFKDGGQIIWDKQSFRSLGENAQMIHFFLNCGQKGAWIASLQDAKWQLSHTKSNDFTNESLLKADNFTINENFVITKLYEDKMGILWIGTNGYGLRKYHPIVGQFQHFLPGETMGQVYKDKQNNLYAHITEQYKNANIVRRMLALYPSFDNELPQKQAKTSLTRENNHFAKRLKEGFNYAILLDFQAKNWLLTSKDEVGDGEDNILVANTNKWEELTQYDIPFPLFRNTILQVDKKEQIWISCKGAKLLKFNPTTGNLSAYHFGAAFANNAPNANFFYFDVENTLWIATDNGVVKGIEKKGDYTFQLLQNDRKNPQSLPSNSIASFCDDPENPSQYIWIGTKGAGLVRMDKVTQTCVSYTEKNGLPNNVVYGILPDEAKNLWLSTNRGIARFNPKTAFFRVFTKEDGLQEDEFNTLSFSKTAKGELCFGGVNGFNVFNPAKIQTNTFIPLIAIVGFKVNNKNIEVGDSSGVLQVALQYPQEIYLNYLQNNLSFSFIALDYTTSNRNEYKYILEGADRDWVYAGTQNVVNYTALPPGNYTFKVHGRNADGIWSEQAATLSIVIAPPFWRTNLAYFLYFLLLIYLAYRAYQAQIKRIKLANQLEYEHKEMERLAALDELKMRFFSNVTHEFRTPLTLILEPARQLVKQLQDKSMLASATIIQNNSQKLLNLVNELLDLSKLESGNMKVDWVYGDVLPIIHAIYASFQVLAKQKGLSFTWIHPEEIPPFSFDKDKMEKILHNLLSNAFKFTQQGGNIQLTTVIEDNTFQIKVKDDGIGMSEATQSQLFQRFYQAENSATKRGEGTGIGLSLIKELVHLLKGRIQVNSELNKGTTFWVMLPIDTKLDTAMPLVTQSDKTELIQENPENEAVLQYDNLVLLVEDNIDMRAMVGAILRKQGFHVIEAENGKDGIEKAYQYTPDLIVSDVMMPEKDGYELTEILKNDIRTSHIPIILLTAKSSLDSRLIGLKKGADEYLGKPFHSEELILRIERLIDIRKKIQATFQPANEVEKLDTTAENAQIALSDIDQAFIQSLQTFIDKHIDNTELDVQDFTEAFFLSRSQLHRKMIALTQQSITEFLRNYRLAKAKELLMQKIYNVNEVADRTGFGNAKYFATAYKKRYGISPSDV